MNLESKDSGKPERDPTPHDLQELEIKATGLGRGNLVHEIEHHLGMLKRTMENKDAKKNPWPNYLREAWDEHFREINKKINQVKIEKAREEGLL